MGKSAISMQMVEGRFVGGYDPTIEDSYSQTAVVHTPKQDTPVIIKILDTAGQEEYCAMREQYIKDGEGFVLVYDVTSRNSFLEAAALQSQMHHIKGHSNIPVILVGNKTDITKENPELRQVTTEEGYSMAQLMGEDVLFAETSAKFTESVEKIFSDLLCLVAEHNKDVPKMLSPTKVSFTEKLNKTTTNALNAITRPINKKSSKITLSGSSSEILEKKSSSNLASLFTSSSSKTKGTDPDSSRKLSPINPQVSFDTHVNPEKVQSPTYSRSKFQPIRQLRQLQSMYFTQPISPHTPVHQTTIRPNTNTFSQYAPQTPFPRRMSDTSAIAHMKAQYKSDNPIFRKSSAPIQRTTNNFPHYSSASSSSASPSFNNSLDSMKQSYDEYNHDADHNSLASSVSSSASSFLTNNSLPTHISMGNYKITSVDMGSSDNKIFINTTLSETLQGESRIRKTFSKLKLRLPRRSLDENEPPSPQAFSDGEFTPPTPYTPVSTQTPNHLMFNGYQPFPVNQQNYVDLKKKPSTNFNKSQQIQNLSQEEKEKIFSFQLQQEQLNIEDEMLALDLDEHNYVISRERDDYSEINQNDYFNYDKMQQKAKQLQFSVQQTFLSRSPSSISSIEQGTAPLQPQEVPNKNTQKQGYQRSSPNQYTFCSPISMRCT